MKKKLFLLFTIGLFFVSTASVRADLIMPGEKPLGYCFIIENISSYSDYQFSADSYLGESISYTQIIKENECIQFYKFLTVKISAVKINEPNARPVISDLAIQGPGIVNENNPLDKINDILTIKSVNDSDLIIEKTKVIYTYNNGTTEEKYYQNQNERPAPSKTFTLLGILKDYFGYAVIITIILEFLIIWLFIKGNPIKPFLASLIINIITVPLANFININFDDNYFIEYYFSIIIIIEIFVFIIESLFLMWLLKIKYPKALLISFIANLITFLIGLSVIPMLFYLK